MTMLGFIGVLISTSDGWVWRNPGALTATEIADGKQRRFNLVHAGCKITGLGDTTFCKLDRPNQILVFGDSHEVDGYNAFSAVYDGDPSVNLILFGAFNGCEVQFGASGPFSTVDHCKGRVALLNDPTFAASLKGLVFSQNKPFDGSAADLWRVIVHLRKMNRTLPVAVLGGFINTSRECSELYSEFHSFSACKNPDFVVSSAFNERERWPLPDDVRGLEYLYIDKMGLLCRDGILSSCVIEAGGEPAFYDMHHLSLGFSTYVGRRLASVYDDELKLAGFPPTTRSR